MLGKKRINEKSLFKSECFLSKLYDILDDNNNKNIIHWDAEGKKIIIKDIISFCNIILPKYYKHQNYSSFIRQLNLYGFHKNKGAIKNIEEYENEKFNKNSTKTDITKIPRMTKKMKKLIAYIKSDKNEKSIKNKNDYAFNESGDNILINFYKNIEDNMKNFIWIKKEKEELKKENKILSRELEMLKYKLRFHNILIKKIINYNKNKIQNNKESKIKNLKDLFNKYLYLIKIYSPFVKLDNSIIIKQKKSEAKQPNIDNVDEINNNNDSNVINEKSFTDEISILNSKNDLPFFIFPNIFTSNEY